MLAQAVEITVNDKCDAAMQKSSEKDGDECDVFSDFTPGPNASIGGYKDVSFRASLQDYLEPGVGGFSQKR